MSYIAYSMVKLIGGTLYPAYESFKAVKTRDVKEYVRWMTYWIVYSLLSLGEEFSDLFLSWIPFYFVLKIGVVLWLVSPTTRGASLLYRAFIHPTLANKEEDIDQMLENLAEQSYSVGIRYARVAAQKLTRTVIETAIKGGGGLVETLQKSYSMNDLTSVGTDDHHHGYQQKGKHPDMRRGRREDMTKSWHEEWEDEGIESGGSTRLDRRRTLNTGHRSHRRSPATSSMDRRETVTRRSRPRPVSMLVDSTPEDEGKRMEEHDFLSDQGSGGSPSIYSTMPRTYRKSRNVGSESSSTSSQSARRPASLYSSKYSDSKAKTSSLGGSLKDTRKRPPRPQSSSGSAKSPVTTSPESPTEKSDNQENEFSMSYSEGETTSARSCTTM